MKMPNTKRAEDPQAAPDGGAPESDTGASSGRVKAHGLLDRLETDVQRGIHWGAEQLLELVKEVRGVL